MDIIQTSHTSQVYKSEIVPGKGLGFADQVMEINDWFILNLTVSKLNC